ncbi:hypothetical protein BC567DRAFT_260886 [Phyllosticta citribraziliensis]
MVSQWMKSLGWQVKLESKTHLIERVLVPSALAKGYQGVEENLDAEVPSTSQPRNSSGTTHADRKESPQPSGWNSPRNAKSSDQAAFSNQSAVAPTAITDSKPIVRSAWEESPTTSSTTEESKVRRTSWDDPEPSAPTDVFSTSSLTDTENGLLGSSSNSSTGGSLSDSDAWELLNTKKASAPGQDSETPVASEKVQLRATRDALVVNSPRMRQRMARRREREAGRATRMDHDLNVLQQLQSRGSGLPVSKAPWLHAAGREKVSHNDARDGVGGQQSNASPGNEQLARLVRSRQGGTYRDEGGSWDKQQSQIPPGQPDRQTFPFLAWLGTSAAAFMHFPLIQHLKQQQQQKRKSGSGQLENTTLRVTEADQKWTFCNEEGRSVLTRPIPRKDQFQELREWWQRHDKADGRDIDPAHIYLRYLEHHYLDPEQHQVSIVPLMEHLVQDQQRPGELAHTTLSLKVKKIDCTYFFHDEEGRQLYKRSQPNAGEHQKLKQWWQQQQQSRQEHGKSAYQERGEKVTDAQMWLMLLKQHLLQQQEEQRTQSRQPSESSAAQEEVAVDPPSPSIQQPVKQSEQPQAVPLRLQRLVNYILQYQQERRRPGDSKNKLPPELIIKGTRRKWIYCGENGVILLKRNMPNSSKKAALRLWWQQRQKQQGQPFDECEAPPHKRIWVEKVEQKYVQMLSSSAKGEAADFSSTPSSSPPLGRSEKEEVSTTRHQDRISESQDLTSEQLRAMMKRKGYNRAPGPRVKWIYWNKHGDFLLRRGKVRSDMLQGDWKFRRLQPHEQSRLRQWTTESSNAIEGDKAESGNRIARIPPPSSPPPPPPPPPQQQQQEEQGVENGAQPLGGRRRRCVVRDEEGRVIAVRTAGIGRMGLNSRRKLLEFWDWYQQEQQDGLQQPIEPGSPNFWQRIWELRAKAQQHKWEQGRNTPQFATSSSAKEEGAENTMVPQIPSPPPAEQRQESKEQESSSLMSRLDKISQGKTK